MAGIDNYGFTWDFTEPQYALADVLKRLTNMEERVALLARQVEIITDSLDLIIKTLELLDDRDTRSSP